MVRKPLAILFIHAKDTHRQASDRARDAVAVKIERCKVRRPDVAQGIHLHTVDDPEKILFCETEDTHRLGEARYQRPGTAFVERVDLRAPLVELRQPLATRTARLRQLA